MQQGLPKSIDAAPARAKPPADCVGVAHFSVFYLFENRRRRLKIFGILNSELGALSALNFGFIAQILDSNFGSFYSKKLFIIACAFLGCFNVTAEHKASVNKKSFSVVSTRTEIRLLASDLNLRR